MMKNARCLAIVRRTSPYVHHELEVEVTLKNDITYTIFRKYSNFIDLQAHLVEKYKDKMKKVPRLPAMSLLNRIFAQEKKLKKTNDFLQGFCSLPNDILDSDIVQEFFTCEPLDNSSGATKSNGLFFSRLWQKRRESGDAALPPKGNDSWDEGKSSMPALSKGKSVDECEQRKASLPMVLIGELKAREGQNKKTSPPPVADRKSEKPASSTDLFRATENFEAQEHSELDLQRGEEYLVLEKSLTGWWLVVEQKSLKEGWVPGSFLQSTTADTRPRRPLSFKSKGTRCIMSQNYTPDAGSGVSLTAGSEVFVKETSEDGWWLIRYQDCMMKVPAALLLPVEQADFPVMAKSKLSGSEESIVNMIHDIRRDCSISKRGPPPPPKRYKKECATIAEPMYSQVKRRPGKPPSKPQGTSTVLEETGEYEVIDHNKDRISNDTHSKNDEPCEDEIFSTFASHSILKEQLDDVDCTTNKSLSRSRHLAVSPRCVRPKPTAAHGNTPRSTHGLDYVEVDLSTGHGPPITPEEPQTVYTEVSPVSLPPLNIPPPKKHTYENVFHKLHVYENVDISETFAATERNSSGSRRPSSDVTATSLQTDEPNYEAVDILKTGQKTTDGQVYEDVR